MERLLNFLVKRNVIFVCLFVIIIINIGFARVPEFIGGQPLDLLMNAEDSKIRIAQMSDGQKQSHLWITWTLDALYPLAYGGFFAGLTARFSKRLRPLAPKTLFWLIVPAFSAVILDYVENIVQTIALMGPDKLLGLKDIITPLKFTSAFIAALIAISFFALAGIKKFSKKA